MESVDEVDSNFTDYLGPRVQNDLIMDVTNENEILEVVAELGDVSPGCDDVPGKIVTQIIHLIMYPILHICNRSLISGTFPSKLKIAKVFPIYKKGGKSLINNYRPISVFPYFSKIIEKIVNKRLVNHLDTNDIIIDPQHGFRQGRSTTSAILSLTDYILKSFDDCKFVCGIFLDFMKAFETVNHDILLDKLEHIGIRNNALTWFRNYLLNRKQFVSYNKFSSSTQYLKCSIPQGSILGPQLFSIYINDLVNSLKIFNLVLFADDSCVYHSHQNIDHLINIANNELPFIYQWLCANKLTLNIEKSHCIIFRRKKKLPPNIAPIQINNHIIKYTTNTNFLGLLLNYQLSWTSHIGSVISKLNKFKGILYITRNSLTINALKLIYNGLIYPQLMYCNIIWGNTYPTVLKPLEIVQRNIIRTLMFRNRFDSTDNDFIKLKLLKLKEVNFLTSCVFVFKSLNNLTAPINYFTYNINERYNLRSPDENLSAPFMRSRQSQTSPSYYCCEFWNSLPLEMRRVSSVSTFKINLKKCLLDSYILD